MKFIKTFRYSAKRTFRSEARPTEAEEYYRDDDIGRRVFATTGIILVIGQSDYTSPSLAQLPASNSSRYA